MKNILFVIAFAIFCHTIILAQPCLPEGIYFTSQAQIDSFQINYPNCTEIEGWVEIGGDDITNLNGLNVLTSIGGFLWIEDNYNLYNLTGLEALTTIGGGLAIIDNSLTSLTGLDALTFIEDTVAIIGNEDLTSLTALINLSSFTHELWIIGNSALTNLAGLDNVTSIGGSLNISDNEILTNLAGLDNVISLGGYLQISHNNNLINLSGLDKISSIGGNMDIWSNDALTSLLGLDNLTSISGNLEILYNDALTSLSGLDNLYASSIVDLNITDNGSLSICEVESICDYLTSPTGEIEIHDNATGCNSISEVEEACGIISQSCLHEGVTFSTQEQIDSFQINYPDCIDIAGDVTIEGPNITNLNGFDVLISFGGDLTFYGNNGLINFTGLENVSTIEGGLWIAENNVLESLTGLNNLTSIGGNLTLDGNATLTNLTGLNNITSIGGFVEFWCCDALTSLTGLDSLTYIGGGLCIWVSNFLENLTGLNALTSIGGGLCISGNYKLSDLTGLNALTSIGGDLEIEENYTISSLAGLDNIENNSILSLYIRDNNSLSTCEIQSICNYLLSPGGEIYISDNASGCNSQEEVEAACDTVSINEFVYIDKFAISPNPFGASALIEYTLHHNSTVTLKICDMSGREVVTLVDEFQRQGEQNIMFDGARLKSGIYFCVLKTNPARAGQTIKMIKL